MVDELKYWLRKYCNHVVFGRWLEDSFWKLMFVSTLILLAIFSGEFGWGGVVMISETAWLSVEFVLGLIMLLSAIILAAFVLLSGLLLNERWQLVRSAEYLLCHLAAKRPRLNRRHNHVVVLHPRHNHK